MICTDSMSCLQSISSRDLDWLTNIQVLKEYHNLTMLGKQIEFCWFPSHVGIPGNEQADALAKIAINQPTDEIILSHYQDLFDQIRRFITHPSKTYGTNPPRQNYFPLKTPLAKLSYLRKPQDAKKQFSSDVESVPQLSTISTNWKKALH